jgi:DNA polymerase I
VKIAMLHVDEEIKRRGFKAQLLMQVHDELLLEVPEKELDEVAVLVKHEMESAVSLDVPLVADVGVGDNWMDAKP